MNHALHPTRFHVNFAVGQDDGADVAFHFNPRFDGWDKVVFNTMQSGRWGKEEEKSMPFQKGKHFELVFMVMPEHYKVGPSPSLPAAPSLPVAPLPPCSPPSLLEALPVCSPPSL